MADGPFQWLPGNPKWEQIYFGSSLVVTSIAVFFGALSALSLLAQAGLVSLPAGFDAWFGTGNLSANYLVLAAVPAVLDGVVVRRLPEHHAGAARVGVSAVGVAVRLPYRIRIVPWSDVRWETETRMALRFGRTTVRIDLTRTQSAGVHRVLHPPLSSGR
jgi:hypothetical protein